MKNAQSWGQKEKKKKEKNICKSVSEENKENIQRIREGRQKKKKIQKENKNSDILLRKKKIVKAKFSYKQVLILQWIKTV